MGKVSTAYVPSFQTESFYTGKRYHWMICRADKSEELVSWGHEASRELAEGAAEKELQVLSSGGTQGRHVTSRIKSCTRHTVHGIATK